ncbi:MAG TPA: flagellar basal body rod protein FlgB [Gammaproteobacteria bacterium]|nr:flagellar basal body rod protein FlgB [Gammaproteobacteria bacterium]
MAISLDKALGIHVQALKVRAARAQVLAANIANADTPHYLAKDIDFKAVLNQALAGNGTLKTTDPRHFPSAQGVGEKAGVKYRVPLQPSLDGNTVDTQIEQAEFARNAVQHQASLTFLSGRIKGLISAIKGE